jgi:3-isopropylmalate dehydratase small subunit
MPQHLQQKFSGKNGRYYFQNLPRLSSDCSSLFPGREHHGPQGGDVMGLPKRITGKVWKLGDHINTDILHPSPYFSLNELRVKEGLVEVMERLGAKAKRNPSNEELIIVAGENFGCGSSRETSVRGLRTCGVKGVVATSFARIFFRSLTNLGIPTLECGEIQNAVRDGDLIHISFKEGLIEITDGRRFSFAPIDPHIKKILEAGGLIHYLLKDKQNPPP